MNHLDKRLKAIEGKWDEEQKAAQAIKDAALGENRSTTEEEREQIKAHLKSIDLLRADKASVEGEIALSKEVDDAAAKIDIEAPQTKEGQRPRLKSLGDQFIEAQEYKQLIDRGFRGEWKTGQVELRTKATLIEGDTPGAGGFDLVQPDVQAGILSIPFQAPTVADLMASGQTSSNLVRYLQETVATNAASGVAEGDPKPESTLEFEQVDEPVRKIATFLPVSDEMLEDVAQIRSYINARLALFIRIAEDNMLLNGNGMGANLEGLLERDIQGPAAAGDNNADSIYNAITDIRTAAFVEPDGLVIHPEDWAALRLSKDENLQYYGGGPFTGAYGNSGLGTPNAIWSLRAVVTSAIAAGTALVGAFGVGAQVFRRGGLTVEASNSHSDYFVHNLTAIRAEERLALAVYRPDAFSTVSLGS